MATTTPLVSVGDGPRLTVNDYIRDPLRIPQLVLDVMANQFIAESVLRNAGQNDSGAARFAESTPLYADDEPDIRGEFAEVPVTPVSTGLQRVAFAAERALAVMVSDEARRRSNVDRVNQSIQQVKNTMVRSWDTAFLTQILNNPSVQKLTITTPWGTAADDEIRDNLIDATQLIEEATPEDRPNDFFDFSPDMMILNPKSKNDVLKNVDFSRVYQGNIADENIKYTGKLPSKIYDLNVVISRRLPVGKAIVCQRGVCGFYSDELPLQASPLYRDEPRKTFRSDVQRASLIGIDQPLAVCVLNGV